MEINQKGRSMVEMLGVLAIIGVLSVGAIAGYQKAMMKYKLNKHLETTNFLLINAIQNIKTFEKDKENTVTYYGNMFNKLNLIPSTMKYVNNSNIYDIFSNSIAIYSNDVYYGLVYTFSKSSYNKPICMNLFEVAKANVNDLKIVQFSYKKEEAPTEHNNYWGSLACETNSSRCLKDKNLTDFQNICDRFSQEQGGQFYMAW